MKSSEEAFTMIELDENYVPKATNDEDGFKMIKKKESGYFYRSFQNVYSIAYRLKNIYQLIILLRVVYFTKSQAMTLNLVYEILILFFSLF